MPTFCLTCKVKSTCKAICKELEHFLNQRSIRGYSPAQIKRKERLFSTSELDRIAGERAFKLKFGSRKVPDHLQGD